jgi:hypothetical protein
MTTPLDAMVEQLSGLGVRVALYRSSDMMFDAKAFFEDRPPIVGQGTSIEFAVRNVANAIRNQWPDVASPTADARSEVS